MSIKLLYYEYYKHESYVNNPYKWLLLPSVCTLFSLPCAVASTQTFPFPSRYLKPFAYAISNFWLQGTRRCCASIFRPSVYSRLGQQNGSTEPRPLFEPDLYMDIFGNYIEWSNCSMRKEWKCHFVNVVLLVAGYCAFLYNHRNCLCCEFGSHPSFFSFMNACYNADKEHKRS